MTRYEKLKIILWRKTLMLLININDYKIFNNKFKKIKEKLKNNNKFEFFFDELKKLFWINFCNIARDYIEIIFSILFKNKKDIDIVKNKPQTLYNKKIIKNIKFKYLRIWKTINNSNFLKNIFLGEYIGKYKAYSFALHDYNTLSFSNKNIKLIEKEYINITNLLNNYSFSNIKNEIEQIYIYFLLDNNDCVDLNIPEVINLYDMNNINKFGVNILNLEKMFNLNNVTFFNFLDFYNIFDFLDYIYKEMYGKDENENKW